MTQGQLHINPKKDINDWDDDGDGISDEEEYRRAWGSSSRDYSSSLFILVTTLVLTAV